MTRYVEVCGALSNDLLRVALASYRKSDEVAGRFEQEAHKRIAEAKQCAVTDYSAELLPRVEQSLSTPDRLQRAENCLMYSTLLQNYVLHHLN